MFHTLSEAIIKDIDGLNAEFEEMDDAVVTLIRVAELMLGKEDQRIVRFLATNIRGHAMELHGQAVQALEDIARGEGR